MKNDTTKKKTELTTEFEDSFSKPSPNKNFWNFADEPNDWDKFDPTTASDKEVAEMVANHFASSEFYLEKRRREELLAACAFACAYRPQSLLPTDQRSLEETAL